MASDATAQCAHKGPRPQVVYRPRSPEDGVLHRIVRQYLETFLQEVSSRAGGHPLPAFVEREFRDFLSCGSFARGFARFRCENCAFEHLVPFSCKGRAVCSSCTGRRMNERAAERGISDPRSGTVTAIQRCGSALDVNLHFHTLAPDGVFTDDQGGTFYALPPPTDGEITRLLTTIRLRVMRLLRRRSLLPEEDTVEATDPAADMAPALAGITVAAVQGRVATGRRAGGRLRRIGADPDAPWVPHDGPRHAHEDGFDLHANIAIHERDRAGLERLARYILRPPVAQDRLQLRDDGLVVLKLPRTWSDGTTHIVFEPSELLERLATLTPGHASISSSTAASSPATRPHQDPSPPDDEGEEEAKAPRRRHHRWADLMRRAFECDVLRCPQCPGRLRFIATIESPEAIRRILTHLGLPTTLPRALPARAPPGATDDLFQDFSA